MVGYSPIGSSHPIADLTGNVPTTVNVTTSSTQLLAANDKRRFCIFSNIGNRDAFIAVGQTAVGNQGFALFKGEQITIGRESAPPKEEINAIVNAGNTDITILEVE